MNREAGLGLVPYPVLSPSLLSHSVSVDVKHHERRKAVRVRIGGRNLLTSCSRSLSDVCTMITSPQPSDYFESSGAVFRPRADSTGTYL